VPSCHHGRRKTPRITGASPHFMIRSAEPIPDRDTTSRPGSPGTASAGPRTILKQPWARWCAATKIRYGDLLRVTGKSARALTAYQEAMDAFESLSDPLWAARALVGIALINAAAGSLDASLSQLDRSRATFKQFRFESDECWTQVCRFRVLQETDHAAADQALADAHRIADAMGYASTYVERLLADAGPDVR
jgi:MalT-like TPR region